MNCWYTFLSRTIISAVLIAFIANTSLVAAAADDATDAGLVPIHDTQTGSLVGYVDMQQQEVFNSQHKYVGAWDNEGTYDASGDQILDKPLPGMLLANSSAPTSEESQSTLVMPKGKLLNRIVIEQVPVPMEVLQERIVEGQMGRAGRVLTDAERAEREARRKLLLEKKAKHKLHPDHKPAKPNIQPTDKVSKKAKKVPVAKERLASAK
jgi:hypothetical protein